MKKRQVCGLLAVQKDRNGQNGRGREFAWDKAEDAARLAPGRDDSAVKDELHPRRLHGFWLFGLLGLCICMLLLVGGCGSSKIAVDTLLTVDSSCVGARVMTCNLSGARLGADEEERLDRLISQYCPQALTCAKTGGDSAGYVFSLQFDSYQDYVEKLTGLLGREPEVVFATPNTIFAKGSRISEDFDSSQLFGWLYAAMEQEQAQGKRPALVCGGTAVSIEGKTQTTSHRIGLNSITGCAVDRIDIATVNNGDGTYDRTITFRIPLKTVHQLGADLESYMNARTADFAAEAVWTEFASGKTYSVRFERATIDELKRGTNLLLNTPLSGQITFEADPTGSTPFTDRSIYEETLDLSSYVADKNRDVSIYCSYQSKTGRTQGRAQIYREGEWREAGDLEEGLAVLQDRSGMLRLRVPEQMSYALGSTEIFLSCLGHGQFSRQIDFLFGPQDFEGVQYAVRFLQAKNSGAQIEQTTSDQGLVCRVATQGEAQEITKVITALFGEGNGMEYQSEGGSFEVHKRTQLSDTLRMANLYSGENANAPIYYTIQTNGKEQLDDVRYESETRSGKVNLSTAQDGAVRFQLSSGDTQIVYNGNTPNALGIVLAFAGVIFVIALVVVILIFVRKRGDSNSHHPHHSDGSGGLPEKASTMPADSEESIEDILSQI